MKKLFFLFLFVSTFSAKSQSGFAFVELFTSEGSDVSPVGEEILNRVVSEEKKLGNKVFVLEYHVDYWNNRGWKDPYSKYQYTMRQENYSRVLIEKELYTPEVVVNGMKSFSATKERTVRDEIKLAIRNPLKEELKIVKDSISKDTLFLSYTFTHESNNAAFRVAITQSGLTNTVLAGENKSKTLVHENVVQLLYSFDGVYRKRQVKIPLGKLSLGADFRIIGFIQRKQTMVIEAAAEL